MKRIIIACLLALTMCLGIGGSVLADDLKVEMVVIGDEVVVEIDQVLVNFDGALVYLLEAEAKLAEGQDLTSAEIATISANIASIYLIIVGGVLMVLLISIAVLTYRTR